MTHESNPTPTAGGSQQEFLAQIRRALGRSEPLKGVGPAPAVEDGLVRRTGPGPDLPDLFAQRAVEVGMQVQRCNAGDLARTLTALLESIGARRITAALNRLSMAGALLEALRGASIEVVPWQSDPKMKAHYDADAGLTDVHAAIAETGTLVCNSDADHGRGLSLVPPVHVAIVRCSDIVPDLLDYMAHLHRLGSGPLPSAVALITGPSKTADIEGVLITGVHGPGKVYILLVEDA